MALEITGKFELVKYYTTLRPKIFVDKQIRYYAGVDIKWETKQKILSKI